MKVVRTIPAARRLCQAADGPLVFVPTMGALHAGHAALISRARRVAGRDGFVVVSIFVNPTQFGPGEDLSRYPRPFAADRKFCEKFGADLLFHPEAAGMYAPDFSTYVEECAVSSPLCGASRPGHFRGVCTVLLKLFSIIQPQVAIFGMKDFQQGAVIQRMVRDLNLPVRIVLTPTVREKDGLALSSRNSYLTPEQRSQAPALRRSLLEAETAWKSGVTSAAALRKLITRELEKQPLARVDYIEVVQGDSLRPVKKVQPGTLLALAVFFGHTRIIDNLLIG